MNDPRTLSVLHVSQPTEAGVARIAADLAADQVKRGWRVGVASPNDGALPGWVRAGGATHLEWSADRSPGPGVGGEVRRLGKCVREFQPDLVHLHSSKAGLAGRLLLRGKTPTIFEPNAWSFEAVTGAIASVTRWWERRAARWADAILCVSEAEKELGKAAGIDGKWRVILNGIDLQRFPFAGAEDRAAARRVLGLNDAPMVICVGRLSEQKGQDILLDSWPLVLASRPDARLFLIGDGPGRVTLEERNLPGVHLVGQRDDVPTWLAATDLVAMPSRWEGFSLAMLEALARGRSLVASDVSGSREAIADDAGAVVPIGDVQALASAISERLGEPELTEREGLAGRRRAEENHDLTKTAHQIAQLYYEILSQNTRG
jgi:glycosyltransferase involved in cell wall biosynthesis